jgi:hypothetical protein
VNKVPVVALLRAAQRLAALITGVKYPGIVLNRDETSVADKGDVWWGTVAIPARPPALAQLKPAIPGHLTWWIRKSDAAVLGTR